MHDAGFPILEAIQAEAAFEIEEATRRAKRILSRTNRLTAILCDSDLLAVGVYKAARALGIGIPEELSVVGNDDSMITRVRDPELTTVAVPAEGIGQLAVRSLLKVLMQEKQL